MAAIDYPITRIGTLYFIPVNLPEHSVDLSDFSDEHTSAFGGATIEDLSLRDLYRSPEEQGYVVVQIPFYRNGEQLSLDEVIDGELKRTLRYLYQKGLREDTVFPGVVSKEPLRRRKEASVR